MKISGRTTDDSTFGLLPQSGLSYETHSVDVDARVSIDTYTLVHSQPANNYRPSLHLKGEILAIKPSDQEQGTFPHNIEEISYLQGLAPRFEALYEFTDEQLTELVSRGYFNQGFDIGAESIRSMQGLELPIDKLTIHIVAPDAQENIPLVFADITRLNTLTLDVDNTGYDFVDVVQEKKVQAELDTSAQLGAQEVILDLSEPTVTELDPLQVTEAEVEGEPEFGPEQEGLEGHEEPQAPAYETEEAVTEDYINDLYAQNFADIRGSETESVVSEAPVNVDDALEQTTNALVTEALGEDTVMKLSEEQTVEVAKPEVASIEMDADDAAAHAPYSEPDTVEDTEAEEDDQEFGA